MILTWEGKNYMLKKHSTSLSLFLFILFLLIGFNTSAQITVIQETPVTILESYTGNYNYAVTGGSLRNQSNNVDPCTVVNSDSQALSGVPAGATITRAYLYWSGSGETIDANVTFQGQPITSTDTYIAEYDFFNNIQTFNIDYFNARADVTSIIQGQADPNITYNFSDLTVDTTSPGYCISGAILSGWALVVIYNEASLPLRRVNVYEGFDVNRNNTLNFNVTGLNVPASGTGDVAGIFWEGDETLQGTPVTPEQLRFNGNVLTDALNPFAGAFNSTINVVPSSTEYGVDIDTYDVSAFVSPGDVSASVAVQSANDLVITNVILIAVDTFVPELAITKTSSANGNAVSPGDTITYTIEVTNNSTVQGADNLVVEDILPPGVTYVAGSAQKTYLTDNIVSGTFTYNFSGLPTTFNTSGLTQPYTVTSTDVPAGATLTSYELNVQGNSPFGNEIALIANYPSGTAFNLGAGSFGNNFNETRGPTTVSGPAEGLYEFIWDDTFIDDTNTITAASFTINHELVTRVSTTDSASDVPILIDTSEDFDLPPGESVTITFDVIVDNPLNASITQLTNEVTANADNLPNEVSDTVTDPIAPSSADLSLMKTINNALPKIGDTIIYTLTVKNDGPADATNINVTDVLPVGLTYLSDNSSSTSTTYTSNVWSLSGVTLSSTQSISLEITAQVDSAGTIINTAEITGVDQNDSDSTKNNGN